MSTTMVEGATLAIPGLVTPGAGPIVAPTAAATAAATTPTISYVAVTPAQAAQWLEVNLGPNRKLNPRHVRKLATDMVNGDWRQNGESVKFDRHGHLVDGQHRLAAIVAANMNVGMLIVEGLEPDAMRTIDTGRARSFGDVLEIRKETNSRRLAAAVNAIWRYESGQMAGGGRYVSHAQMDHVLGEHPFVRDAVREVMKVRWLQPEAVIGAVYTLAHERNPKVAEAWMYDLQYGINLEEDNPAYLLRERIRSLETHRERMQPTYAAALTIKSWNAYQAERSMRMLIWRGQGPRAEEFPTIE
jgi:hypothetical protein